MSPYNSLTFARSLAVVSIYPITASAVIGFNTGILVGTDGSGSPIGPITAPTGSVVGTLSVLATDFQSGMFTIAPADLNQVRFVNDGSPVGVKHFIDFGGGTGTIQVDNTTTADGSASQYNAFQFTNLQDVSKITFSSVYTEPIAGRNTAETSLLTRPLGGAFEINGDEAEGMMTIGGAVSATSTSAPFNFGVGVTAPATVNGSVLTPTSPLTFNSSWTGASGNEWSNVRGWDITGTGAYSAADAPLAYATTFSHMIFPTGGGTFDSDALFIYSLDGKQYADTLELAIAVPEPSRALLLMLAMLPGVMRRRRH